MKTAFANPRDQENAEALVSILCHRHKWVFMREIGFYAKTAYRLHYHGWIAGQWLGAHRVKYALTPSGEMWAKVFQSIGVVPRNLGVTA